MITDKQILKETVEKTVHATPILDMHTHLFDTNFGSLLLWGIDELVTYHYLIAETFRVAPMEYDAFWSMDKQAQADHIWENLFIRRSPISEACRGVLTCMQALGFDPAERNLGKIRDYFKTVSVEDYIDRVFQLGNIESVVMTNDTFDPQERPVWETKFQLDSRFTAALRMDKLLVDWPAAAADLTSFGYSVGSDLSENDKKAVRGFLENEIRRMDPVYMAASLPPDFTFPDESACSRILKECVLPVSRETGVPLAMMIGVKKLTNPGLQVAGDSVGKANIKAIEYLCREFPENKFLVTMLSRENQHELCIAARKFSNLMIFGCWWYLNNPSIINEMTRERIEVLGTSFVPQHSDARVLDQLIYKWKHSRKILSQILFEKYADILDAGWSVSEEEIQRDVRHLFSENFTGFIE